MVSIRLLRKESVLVLIAAVSAIVCAVSGLLIVLQAQSDHGLALSLNKLAPNEAIYNATLWLMPVSLAALLCSLALFIREFNARRAKRIAILIENARSLSAGRKPALSLSDKDELIELQRIYAKMYSSLSRLRQREKAILDHAAEGICSLDESLRMSHINHALTVMLGCSAEELQGARLVKYLEPTALEVARQALEEAKRESDTRRFQIVVRSGDSEVVLAWSVVWDPVQSEYYCLVQDVTKQALLDRLKNEFVSMVSHDLRTPLASIELSHGLLSDEDLSPEAADTLAIAQGSVKRLMALVNNLLDLDKLEAGSLAIYQEDTPVARVLQDCSQSLELLAVQKKLKISINIDEQLRAFVDKERLSQVVINILSNAYKFSPPGTTVGISGKNQGAEILIEISDQGPGIPNEMQEEIFERFKQVNKRDKASGTGLGLAICKSIIEKHGGQIGVRSQPASGSTFWFTLPAGKQADK